MNRDPRWQRVYSRALLRLDEMSEEWCLHLELSLTRSWTFLGPKPPMYRELLRTMEAEPPGPAWRARVQHTIKRAYARMLRGGHRAEEFETTINGWLDGQIELAARNLTVDVALRPWGEP